ncbi:MAG: arsenite efflux transporter metallochaperone ArsD [Actinobacteria bacterium]|nr:arsenite efflux transporter metallochaperone ArsD [Actinomycetota bacterium]
MLRIEIYDPPMCCSSGLCGPSIDPVLVKVNDAVLMLKKQGVEVERFNLAQQPKDFMANKQVADLLHKNGKKILPIIIVNGEVFKTSEYPSYEDLCKALGIEPLKTGKPITLQMGQ